MDAISTHKRNSLNSSGASAFQKLAVWEGGYNVSLDVCRESDRYDQSNVITHQLKSAATSTILHLSKAASLKLGRSYVRALKDAYISTKQMATLLLLCHDLGYTSTDSFLTLNRKLNEFSAKLFKYTRFCQKKLRKRMENA
ncbi:four helix bundle protein [Candidatus Woesearchaeota archaeon]|nr:four helix bundle protein [Candidatus Woesearchaeota archaeon]